MQSKKKFQARHRFMAKADCYSLQCNTIKASAIGTSNALMIEMLRHKTRTVLSLSSHRSRADSFAVFTPFWRNLQNATTEKQCFIQRHIHLDRSSYPFVTHFYQSQLNLKGNTIQSHISNRTFSSQRSQTDKDTPSSIPESTTGSFSAIVNSVNRRIPKIEWHLSDLVSVMGIGILFVSILVLPSVVEQMRISPKTYEEIDVEDAMRQEIEDFTQEIHGDIRQFLDRSNIRTSDEIKRSGNTIDIIKEVINSEALRNAITSLVSRIITSAQFQNACKQLMNDLIHDPDTTAQLVQLLNSALNNDIIRRSFKALVLNILQDDEVYHQLTRLVVRLSDDPAVLEATKELLAESAHRTLNDPDILDHSMEFATDVVGDDGVQRTSGEALRHTVSYALRPSLSVLLSILGIGLLAFSFTAIGRANLSAQEGKAIGAAANIVVRNYMDLGITRVLTLGYRTLSFCMHPFRIVGRWTSSVFAGGLRTLHSIGAAFTTIVFIPVSIYRGFLSIADSLYSQIVSACMTAWNDIVIIASMPIYAYQKFVSIIFSMPGFAYRKMSYIVTAIGTKLVNWETAVSSGILTLLSTTSTNAVMWINCVNEKFKPMIEVVGTEIEILNEFLNDFALRLSAFHTSFDKCIIRLWNRLNFPAQKRWTFPEFFSQVYEFLADIGAVISSQF